MNSVTNAIFMIDKGKSSISLIITFMALIQLDSLFCIPDGTRNACHGSDSDQSAERVSTVITFG